jgi:hypothetical protein
LHLVGVGPGALGHWLWDDSSWQSEAPLNWTPSSQQRPAELLTTAVNKQGKMMVVFAQPTSDGNATEMTLLYSIRALDLPLKQTTIQDVPATTLVPPSLTLAPATPTLEQLLTPTVSADIPPANQDQTARNETNNQITPVVMALFPVVLLLLSVLGLAIRQASLVKDR